MLKCFFLGKARKLFSNTLKYLFMLALKLSRKQNVPSVLKEVQISGTSFSKEENVGGSPALLLPQNEFRP